MVKQLAHNELIVGSSPTQRIMIDDRVVECGGLLNHCTQVPRVRIPLYPFKGYVVDGIHARLKI